MEKYYYEKEVLKEYLKKCGFSVEYNGVLRGISGIEHIFELIARKKDLILCFNFDCPTDKVLVQVLGKALDVNYAKHFLISKKTCPCNPIWIPEKTKRFSIIQFETAEDLLRRIRKIISEYEKQ